MPVYLTTHPPASSQYRNTRRATPTGAIVLHTPENRPDLTLPDDGAEGVARYIATRTDPGSYHTVVDSDSIVPVGEYGWEMYGEGTGGNRWALHLAFACRAADWPTLPPGWRDNALRNGAIAAVSMAAWVRATTGRPVPARRITAAQYRAGEPGFISHGELDPGRRTDPGPGFPWTQFLALYASFTDQEVTTPMPTPTTSSSNPYPAETAEALQLLADHAGYTDPDRKWFGPNALAALHRLKNQAVAAEAALATSADAIHRVAQERHAAEARANGLADDVRRLQAEAADLQARLDRLTAMPSAQLLQEVAAGLDTILTRVRGQ